MGRLHHTHLLNVGILLCFFLSAAESYVTPAVLKSPRTVPSTISSPSSSSFALFSTIPRFAQPSKDATKQSETKIKKKVHKTPNRFAADSRLLEIHNQRVKTAGRIGTKRFVNPCKVFIGNVPYDVEEKELEEFVLDIMGQSSFNLHSVKLIRDWKTGKSKGYGFLMFTDPIYATVCIDVVHGKMLRGRPISVGQGKKKNQENMLYIKKKKKKPADAEEAAIESGLQEAEDNEIIKDEKDDDDDENDDDEDDDLELDAETFDMIADDGDGDYDGFYYEPKSYGYEGEIDPNKNREQRREALRKLKRKKRPNKGFG